VTFVKGSREKLGNLRKLLCIELSNVLQFFSIAIPVTPSLPTFSFLLGMGVSGPGTQGQSRRRDRTNHLGTTDLRATVA